MRVSFQWNAGTLSRLASLPQTARALLGMTALATTFVAALAVAQTTPPPTGIAATAHNLSKDGKGNVKAASETQVCVFCHTPHNASTTVAGPLWNRNSSPGSYTRYTSASMDADSIAGGFSVDPGGSSLLCLSCHDGMVALGSVLNVKGAAATISMTDKNGAALTYMPDGDGQLSGYTRNLQKDLSNDHPISVTYDDYLAEADGEMTRLTRGSPAQRDQANLNLIGIRTSTYKPLLPLEPTGSNGAGQVQCATCHDPHLEAQKFLRTNRFQVEEAGNRNFDKDKDQICLACHPKLALSWAESAHAKKIVADEAYFAAAATRRGFPGTPQVWQVGCLNCHDTHTAQGSRRLLREGVNAASSNNAADSFRKLSAAVAASALDTVSSVENTCYQCHTGLGTKIIDTGTGLVPNIEYEFNNRSYRMPIKTEEQTGGTTTENHNIRNANFVECRKNLGNTAELESTLTNHLTAAQKTKCDEMVGTKDNRHVECTDCHNPHRVRRSPFFYGTSATTGDGLERTHKVGGTTAAKGADGNVASGVLRGTWGVEPVYTTALGNTWPQKPDRYDVKYGDPTSAVITRSQPYLTREYQLCFKCHSDYSNPVAAADYPTLGNTGGGTPSGTNGVQRYTNVAAEFASVKFNTTNPDIPGTSTDQGESTRSGTACGDPAGAGSDCAPSPSPPGGTNNHRSWHPVMYPTGRDKAERGSDSFSNIKAPFNVNVGRQTMYCSDCHGDPGAWAATSGKADGVVQGPHGSSKPFLLKGDWHLPLATGTGSGYNGQTPSSPGVCGNCHQPTNSTSGFAGATEASHGWSGKDGVPCTYCHVAVPHGWKNKAFLVNTACVGPESGLNLTYTNGCASQSGQVNAPPYYRNALLRINGWRYSGNWAETACGDGSGKTWMTETCQEGW